MNKLLQILFAVAVVWTIFVGGVAAQGNELDKVIPSFLSTNYKWTVDVSDVLTSNAACPEGRMVNPDGKKSFNWVCRGDLKYGSLFVLWHDPVRSSEGSTLREAVFNNLIGKSRTGVSGCDPEQRVTLFGGDVPGVIHDCWITHNISRARWYVSFLHFQIGQVGFTLYVTNTGSSSDLPQIRDDLRRLSTKLSRR